MRQALELAEQAACRGEVPVGAVLVQDNDSGGVAIGRGSNGAVGSADPTAHAEINALRDAAARLGNYRLPDTTLYVTLEPCLMCAGALVHARVKRLVFGAREPRAGAVVSHVRALESPAHNHRVGVSEGVLAEECASLMQRFFSGKALTGRCTGPTRQRPTGENVTHLTTISANKRSDG